MSKKDKKKKDEPVENIEQALTKTEQFIERNQKLLLYSLVGLIVVVLGYWFYSNYRSKRNDEAFEQMFKAEQSFQQDSFYNALHGIEGYPGFLQIIEDYKGTKAANMAYYYAGLSLMYLNSYDSAIIYLKKFDTDDPILNTEKYGTIADAYVQMQDYENAIKYYKKATDKDYSNDLTTPVYLKKLGLVYEELGKDKEALEVYNKIYKDYPLSQEARQIQKYISRVKFRLGQS